MEGLNLEDEENEARLLPIDPEAQKSVFELCLVECFLTDSVVHFRQ